MIEQIESEIENNRELEQTQPQLRMKEFFVKLQMKIIYKYMTLVNHENRYMYERLLHIFWVLAVLVLVQFHLLHISSFSYIKCMSS